MNNRTNNATRNMFFGIMSTMLNLILTFVSRTFVIYKLGAEYLGLSNLFVSVIQVLSLAELGFGTAVIYSMYKPLADNDNKRICALLKYFRKIYRTIGVIILVVGVACIPFLKYLVNGECPDDINLVAVYMINIVSTASTYLLFSYKNSILTATQRNDIVSKIMAIQVILQNLFQIIALVVYPNYYLYIIMLPVFNIFNSIVTAIVAKNIYPEYYAYGEIDTDERKHILDNVKSLFIYKIGNVVSGSVDTLVISSFLGLTTVAIYGNYYYVISVLFSFLAIYYTSILAGLGNKIVEETEKENYKFFKILFFGQAWIVGWISICLLCLYQNFMYVWVGKKLMFEYGVVILFAIYFYSWKINDIVYTYKDAAGIWKYDKFRPLISSMVNLCINIMLVKVIGVYGVILSTIICELTFSLFWGCRVVYRHYFKEKFSKYIIAMLKYTIINIILAVFTVFICDKVSPNYTILGLIIRMIICIILPNAGWLLINLKNEHLADCVNIAKSILKSRSGQNE